MNALVVILVAVPSALAAGMGIVGLGLGPLVGAEPAEYLRVGAMLLGGLVGAWGSETLRGRPSRFAVAAPGAAVCGMAAGAWILYDFLVW